MGRPSRLAEYTACAEQGMTLSEAAAALGIARQSAFKAAQRHGLQFRNQGSRSHLAEMTRQERAQYDMLLYRVRYTRKQALAAIGRADLIQNPEHTAVTSRPCAGRAAHPPRAGATSPGGRGQSPAGGFHGC
jgi:hypothetical protein